MKKAIKVILLILLSLILAAEVYLLATDRVEEFIPMLEELVSSVGEPTEAPTEPAATEAPTEAPTQAPTEAPAEQPTEAPTEQPTEAPTEAPTQPLEQRFTLTFTGDCTLGSTSAKWNMGSSFVQTIGENYDYPFANLVKYFENDDFTMINLEGVLADDGKAAAKTFAFRGPTVYTQIMTGSSVEAVTLANNHTEDFGSAGYASTTQALGEAGITYVEKDDTAIYATESGLTIGLYAASFNISIPDLKSDIAKLKAEGAEIIVCAFHWGSEGAYRPSSSQESLARQAIDAGADIIYGNHPHVLQKIEEYGDGIIYYSLGNCSFGGSGSPQDYEAAILQQEVIRAADGTVTLGELTIVPISVSSASNYNNYQPTPLEEGSKAYERAMSKLDGTFTGADLVVDYSKLEPTTPETEAPTEVPTEAPTEAPKEDTSSGAEENESSDAGEGESSDAGENSADAGEGESSDAGENTSSDAGDSGSSDENEGSSSDAGADAPAEEGGSDEE